MFSLLIVDVLHFEIEHISVVLNCKREREFNFTIFIFLLKIEKIFVLLVYLETKYYSAW